MRIRKNAKVSAALTTAKGSCVPPELLEPHVCQLNQSPWDAIAVQNSSDDSQTVTELGDYSRYTRKHYDSLAGDSNGPSDNMTLLMRAQTPEPNESANDDNTGIETTIMNLVKKRKKIKRRKTRNITVDNEAGEKIVNNKRKRNSPANKRQGKKVRHCVKNDGKGWQCKKEAKEGYNFCEHHLSQFRSYGNSHSNSAAAEAPETAERRTRGRKGGAFSKPGEFYYYSGFGPRWGRNRGGEEGESGRSSPELSSSSEVKASLPEELEDYDDDDDEEEGKNRNRRPVKARSLKSLM